MSTHGAAHPWVHHGRDADERGQRDEPEREAEADQLVQPALLRVLLLCARTHNSTARHARQWHSAAGGPALRSAPVCERWMDTMNHTAVSRSSTTISTPGTLRARAGAHASDRNAQSGARSHAPLIHVERRGRVATGDVPQHEGCVAVASRQGRVPASVRARPPQPAHHTTKRPSTVKMKPRFLILSVLIVQPARDTRAHGDGAARRRLQAAGAHPRQ